MTQKKKLIQDQIIQVCPECGRQEFMEDFVHDEIFCRYCGLVLITPFSPGIHCQGFRLLHVRIHLIIE